MISEAAEKEQEDSEEVDLGALRKKSKYTVEDITLDLDKKMKIVKKSKKTPDMEVGTKKITKGSTINALR